MLTQKIRYIGAYGKKIQSVQVNITFNGLLFPSSSFLRDIYDFCGLSKAIGKIRVYITDFELQSYSGPRKINDFAFYFDLIIYIVQKSFHFN